MGDKTKIQWTEATWNPTRGCSRVNQDCDNCYAMREAHRHDHVGGAYEGLTRIGKRGVDWSGVVRPIHDKLDLPLRWKRPRMVFVNSMSDLFHPSLSNEEIAAVFGVMSACPQHTFQVLTKRPERAAEWFGWFSRGHGRDDTADVAITCALGVHELNQYVTRNDKDVDDEPGAWDDLIENPPEWPLQNVWLGISAGHQKALDEFTPELLRCPAALHWLSLEPLLEALDISEWLPNDDPDTGESQIRWVVAGGESGNGARVCDVSWLEELRDACALARVPFFLKQLGAVASMLTEDGGGELTLAHRKGGDIYEWPESLRVREFPQ